MHFIARLLGLRALWWMARRFGLGRLMSTRLGWMLVSAMGWLVFRRATGRR